MRERDFFGGDWGALGAQHCSSLCSQSEGDDFLGGLRGLKAQQVASPIISGQARAESPTSPEPRATPWVPCSPSLRPERAKVKNNHSPILLPLQGVGAYTLIPRALPWAMNWLPFQGARGDTGGQARAESPASSEQGNALGYVKPGTAPCKGKSNKQPFAHTFALTGRRRLYADTQGVALGSGLTALSGRSRRNHKHFSQHIRGPHFASKVSYSAAPQSHVQGISLIRCLRRQ